MTYPAAVVLRALGLLDEGMSSAEVGADLNVSQSTIRKWNRRRRDGWVPEDAPCPASTHGSTPSAYTKGCRCPEARAAKSEWKRGYDKAVALGKPRLVSVVGTRRRIEGLMLLGWTQQHIADASGLSLDAVRSLGQRGRMTVSPDVERAVIRATRTLTRRGVGPSAHARSRAKRWGYAPLMAWDDDTIDDPTAKPNTGHTNGHGKGSGRRGLASRLPDPDILAAEVNRSGRRVVAERYGSTPDAVWTRLNRAGYRASHTGDIHELPIYRKAAA